MNEAELLQAYGVTSRKLDVAMQPLLRQVRELQCAAIELRELLESKRRPHCASARRSPRKKRARRTRQ